MAATPTTTRTAFGKRLLAAREKAGMRLDTAAVRAQDELRSSFGPSRETIRRYEIGAVDEDRADMVIVAALARIYKVPMESLSAVLAAQMNHVAGWATPITTAKKKRAGARSAALASSSPNARRRNADPATQHSLEFADAMQDAAA